MTQENQNPENFEVNAALNMAMQQQVLKEQRLCALEEIDRIRESQPPSNEEDTLNILRESREKYAS